MNQDVGMSAGDLLQGFLEKEPRWAEISILGLAMDNRDVKPGFIFMACNGSKSHGLDYVQQALAAGAVLLLAEPG